MTGGVVVRRNPGATLIDSAITLNPDYLGSYRGLTHLVPLYTTFGRNLCEGHLVDDGSWEVLNNK